MKIRDCLLIGISLFIFSESMAQSAFPQGNGPGVYLLKWPYRQTSNFMQGLKTSWKKAAWQAENKFKIDVNEVAFENWSSGGSNSISLLFGTQLKRTLKGENIRWKNEFIGRYGINAQKGRKLRKTDDHLEINSTFGYRPDTLSGWFYSAKLTLKSQFDNGYNYPNREHSISSFMAPGYLFIGVGAELGRDSKEFSLYLSPATLKTTFVLDQRLANQGAFGVSKAIYDSHDQLVKKGRKSKSEFGILVTSEYHKELVENIHLNNRVSLYTDYINDFGNVDVDWKVDFEFRVNKYVAAQIGSHLIYDNDTKVVTKNDDGDITHRGAKVQWKQQLGIGIIVEI